MNELNHPPPANLMCAAARAIATFAVSLLVMGMCCTAPANMQPTTASSSPAPGLPVSPPAVPPNPSPPAVYLITNETDLAQRISATTSPTILILPADLVLSMSLPLISGPIQLQSVRSTSITCVTPNFTAVTSVSQSLGMTGLRWKGCGTVLMLQKATGGADSAISITDCFFHANTVKPAAVSDAFLATNCCEES